MTPIPLRRFIHAADIHLTGTRPRCRLDPDWIDAQRQALRFLVDTANKRQCPLHLGGDIFDKPRVSTEVVVMAIQELQRAEHGVFLLQGNHDQMQANADLIGQTSLGILLQIFPETPSIPGIQDAAPFGRDCATGAKVAFTHQLVFETEDKRPPMAKGHTAQSLLDEVFPDADWVFTGDHHDSWVYTSPDGRHVVNPGCMLIHDAGMIGHKAACFFVDLDAGIVESIEIPDDPSMVSDEHLRSKEERESRVGAFLEKLETAGTVSLDFRANLEKKQATVEPGSKTYTTITQIREKADKEEK